jgi:transposase InsO family protein
MTKYSTELKTKIVGEYLKGVGATPCDLELIMDLYADEILSYNLSDHPAFAFTLTPLHEALEKMPVHITTRTYVHTDQGFRYQTDAWQCELKHHHVYQNMSRKTRDELETALRAWIKYYNESRIKEKLAGQSPIDYRISTTGQVA